MKADPESELLVTLEHELTEDAEDRLLRIYEYLLEGFVGIEN